MAAMESSETTDGPVLNLMSKRLRALRKKHNRIIQMEENMAQGKPLNKEQEEVLRSKPAVVALIEEYEKLRQPLSAAVQEELQQAMLNLNLNAPHEPSSPSEEPPPPETTANRGGGGENDDTVEDLLKLVYFGTLFDVKPSNELNSIMLTRVHERTSCLTYDYVTEDATDLLAERDLDLLSLLGGFVTARPANSTLSHMNALSTCLQHAKLWLQNSEQPIHPEVDISYAGLRERLNKILSLEYFTTTPEMMTLSQHSTVETGAVAGNYVSQIVVNDSTLQGPVIQTENALPQYQHKDEGLDTFEAIERSGALNMHFDQSSPVEEQQLPEDDEGEGSLDHGEDASAVSSLLQDQQKLQQQPSDVDDQQQYYNQRADEELKEQQQYAPRRMTGYPNQRGGSRGGRRGGGGGYMNGRGGGRGGSRGGGYQNGRNQYYDQGNYYPQRNYYGQRGGRGGRGGGAPVYNNNGRAAMAAESDPY